MSGDPSVTAAGPGRAHPAVGSAVGPAVGVVAVVPALDEADRVAATVRALLAVPVVDAVWVVDDGSRDETTALARAAGATVVRHDRTLGKAAALTTGVGALPDDDRPVLLLDADLAESAGAAGALVVPVLTGAADMTVAVLPPQVRADGSPVGGFGAVVGLSRTGIARLAGYTARAPLSGQRCLTRAALRSALPLARGFGVETALTIDVVRAGFRVREVPVPFAHRATGNDLAGRLHRARQLADVTAALGRTALPRPAARALDRSAAAAGDGLAVVAHRMARHR